MVLRVGRMVLWQVEFVGSLLPKWLTGTGCSFHRKENY